MLTRRAQLLPNLITLGNAFCGVLALSKAIDALTLSTERASVFYEKMEAACSLVFLGMILDALDGLVARMTGGGSEFGAQLDSFSDALTFGVVPAMLTKVLVEHEGPGSARLHFLAAASFALMAILRLVRYNLDPRPHARDPEEAEEVKTFQGLPSPAAAGMVCSTIWLYLILRQPDLEVEEGTPTWTHHLLVPFLRDVDWTATLAWVPTLLVGLLPVLGLLMVSNIRYVHGMSYISSRGGQFLTLVAIVFSLILFYLAPVPLLFLCATGFLFSGLVSGPRAWLRERARLRA